MIKSNYTSETDPYRQVIYYRHYKYKLVERNSVQAVQEVIGWIEDYVPKDHPEYPFLREVAQYQLAVVLDQAEISARQKNQVSSLEPSITAVASPTCLVDGEIKSVELDERAE